MAESRKDIGASGQSDDKRDDAPVDPSGDAPTKQRFGGMSASEAGRKGALVREERKRASEQAQAAASDGRVVFVRTPVALGDIVARLSTLAAKGDTSAARELRSWLTEYPVEETTDVAALDRRTREALKAELLVRISAYAHSPDAPMRIGAQEGVHAIDPLPLRPSPEEQPHEAHTDIGTTGPKG